MVRYGVCAILVCAGLVLVGCTEAELARIDRAVGTAEAVGAAASDVAQGPAGPLIPLPVRTGMELAGVILAAVAVLWQQNRNRLLKTTGKAVALAIEDYADPAGVKTLVAQQMERLHIESAGRDVVRSWKAA